MVKLTLKAARVNAGLTQKDVAERLNISNKTTIYLFFDISSIIVI